MREEVRELVALGPFPSELGARDGELEAREPWILALEEDASNEEAIALAPLLGNDDDLFGMAESVSTFIMSAPSWPIWRAIESAAPRWRGMWTAQVRSAGGTIPADGDAWIDEWHRLVD